MNYTGKLYTNDGIELPMTAQEVDDLTEENLQLRKVNEMLKKKLESNKDFANVIRS